MAIITASGTKFYIGSQVTDAVDTAGEFASQTWTEIKNVETFGEFGDESSAVTFSSVGDGRVQKAKGARDAGSLAVTVGLVPDDAGQLAIIAAEGTNKNYAFKMELPDAPTDQFTNTVNYFRGLVMSKRLNVGGNDNVLRRTFNIGINSQIYEVPPAAKP